MTDTAHTHPLLAIASLAARLLPQSIKRTIYRFNPIARLIRRGLNQAAPAGVTKVKIASGGLEGMEMYLDLQLEKDYWLGTYEPELQDAMRRFIQPGWVVYDVGANIGYISLLLGRTVGLQGRVFAFEALPANISRLERNLAQNQMTNRVKVISGAVSDRQEAQRFLVHVSTSMGKVSGSAGREEAYQEEILVPGIQLDTFVYTQGNPPPNAIKMDIEGGEILAIQGMQLLISRAHPVLLIELHGPEAIQAVGSILLEADYTLLQMKQGYPKIQSIDELSWKAYIVAIPRKKPVS